MSRSTPSSSQHPADSHDLIRVQGARENNLKDVSVEIPKRRLTVFTGVSGSGKSSLVFGTIAAESQRLINETYSAFVQGFMPTLARPEVDVLEGLTTAIIVDQERMGANSRSTVGTATDANAMLRVLFSRLGKPHIGSSNAFSFNVPTRSARAGRSRSRRARASRIEKRDVRRTTAACARDARAWARSATSTCRSCTTTASRSTRARSRSPATATDGWYGAHLPRLRASSTRTSRSASTPRRSSTTFLYKEPTKVKVDGHQPHLRGPDPADPEVVPVQGRRRDAAAHPRVRGARGHLHHLSRVRRHPAQRGRPVLQDQGDQHRRRLRDADQRPGRVGARSGRAVRRAAAGDAAAHARLVRGDRAGLPQPRPAVRHAVGR